MKKHYCNGQINNDKLVVLELHGEFLAASDIFVIDRFKDVPTSRLTPGQYFGRSELSETAEEARDRYRLRLKELEASLEEKAKHARNAHEACLTLLNEANRAGIFTRVVR